MKALVQPLTPEHDKQQVAVETVITDFLEFLDGQKITLCKLDEQTDQFYPFAKTDRQLIFEFFGIDFEKWEQENRMLLDYLRGLNKVQIP